MKYIKKPVTVDAYQTDSEAKENASELPIYKDVSSLEDVAYEHRSEEFVKGVQFILGKLYALPEAQLDLVPSAAWELHDSGSATCSRCHRTQKNIWDADNIQRYCGSCGARMRIEESTDEQ